MVWGLSNDACKKATKNLVHKLLWGFCGFRAKNKQFQRFFGLFKYGL